MTHTRKMLIVDPDCFFVARLQHVVKTHFQARDILVLFMGSPLSYPLAGLIFWVPGYPAAETPTGLLYQTRYFLLKMVRNGQALPSIRRINNTLRWHTLIKNGNEPN